MELPSRPKGDQYTKPGEYPALRRRVRSLSAGLSIPTVVAYAFDNRTRLLPYFFSTHQMAPAGARAVGSALYDSGLTKTRIVLQQWNRAFRPSQARLDGEPIEMLMVSSMQIHAERAYGLIADSCRGPGRPLILVGGPKAIYEPWDLFGIGGRADVGADVVVTGEEFILIQLIEVLLSYRGATGTMREAFRHARRDGALGDVPGLVYRRDDAPDAPLVTTGIQRLVQDLDELPHPVIGYKLLEEPHRRRDLRPQALPASRVWRHSVIGSLRLTHGCKFNCDYCPIPAYNQRTWRSKSGERIVDELSRLHTEYGIRFFFGTDDNFFNNRSTLETLFETMSRAKIGTQPLHKVVRWGTEATEFDAWKNRDLLGAARKSGLRAIWFGIEDMTATLINKGQTVNKTAELFGLLNQVGICPMPMLMHHDAQPLYTREGLYGLLNQVSYLRKCGARSMQVTVLTPAVGTRSFNANYDDGIVFETVGGERLRQYQFDGNHTVASSRTDPWRTQLNTLVAYAWYYNPINFVRLLAQHRQTLALAGAYDQLSGMISLIPTAADSIKWAYRLWRGPITHTTAVPGPKVAPIDVSTLPDQRPATKDPSPGIVERASRPRDRTPRRTHGAPKVDIGHAAV